MSKKKYSKKYDSPPKEENKNQKPNLLNFDSLESEFDYFKNAYENLKDKKAVPRISDLDIIHTAISYLENPEQMAKEIKKSPELILFDPVYQAAIWFLRNLCEREQNENHKWARKLLRDLDLAIFIPQVPKNITDHAFLLHYQKNIAKLYERVEHYSQLIKKYIDTDRPYLDQKDKIKELFNNTFEKEIIKRIPEPNLLNAQRLLQIDTIALAFISYEIDAPYEALKKIYYKKKL